MSTEVNLKAAAILSGGRATEEQLAAILAQDLARAEAKAQVHKDRAFAGTMTQQLTYVFADLVGRKLSDDELRLLLGVAKVVSPTITELKENK